MKRFNITTQGTYTKNGEEKKTYPQIGKLVHFPKIEDKEEGFILELNMFPNTKFYVFEDTPKEKKEDYETSTDKQFLPEIASNGYTPNVNDPVDGFPF